MPASPLGANAQPGLPLFFRPQPGVWLPILSLLLLHFNSACGAQALEASKAPANFINALADCAARGASLASADLVLAAAGQDRFWGTEKLAQVAGGATLDVDGLWTWDDSRLCRAALLTQRPATASGSGAVTPAGLISLEGRSCVQRLSYVCVPDADVRAAGLTPSSDWFRTHVQNAGTSVGTTANATAATAALVVGSSSPHLLGPERSGLVLLRSGYALGGTRVTLGLKADEWGPSMMQNASSLYSQLRTAAFDDSGLFWSRGPVVSAFFRSHNGRLLALRPVREAEVVEVAAAAAADTAAVGNTNTSAGLLSDGGVFGASRPDLDGIIAPYETHHVGPYNDYVVSVQGCFRTLAVEVLVLVTRSGRRYRLGRGSCSVWFREDAPPGGYLAGFAGLHMDIAYWSTQPPLPWAEGQLPNAPWLMQVELVWAAPAGSPPPTYTQRLPALLLHSTAQIAPPSSACPGAYPLASLNEELMPFCTWPWRETGQPYTFAPTTSVGCASNLCCSKPLYMPGAGVYIPYNYSQPTCSADPTGCLRSCQIQAGLCGVVPDRPVLHFALTSPPAAADDDASGTDTPDAAAAPARLQQQQSYIVYPDTHVTQEAAADMCRSSTHMGLAWRLVTAREILGWTAALEIRHPAYSALAELDYFWLGDVGTGSGSGTACMTALYGYTDSSAAGGGETVTYDSSMPCDGIAAVVCALAVPLEPVDSLGASSSSGSSSLVQPAGRDASRAWTPGPHRLAPARRSMGYGNFGNFTCAAILLAATNSTNLPTRGSSTASSSSSTAQQQPALAANLTVTLEAPPRAFLVSTAIQASELGNSVSAVSGLGVELGGGAAADGPAAADRAILTAGNPSTRGWHRLELLPGEVVVAASGCAGGHLELLLLHTSSGRVLAPPLTAGPEGAAGGSAACTSSFVEAAPAGSYLVGFQVTFGQFIESMRLLWGQPLAASSGAVATSDGSSSGSSGHSHVGESTGNEGRGGVLDSVVGSGPNAAESSTTGPQQAAAAGDQQSSGNAEGSSSSSITPQAGSGGNGGGGALSPGVIGGAVTGAVVLVLTVSVAVVLLMHRRRRNRHQQQLPKCSMDAMSIALDPADAASPPPPGDSNSSAGTASTQSSSAAGGRAASRLLAVCDIKAPAAAAVPPPPPGDYCPGPGPAPGVMAGAGAALASWAAAAGQPVARMCGETGEACVTLLVDAGDDQAAAAATGPAAGVAAAGIAARAGAGAAAGAGREPVLGGGGSVLRYAAPAAPPHLDRVLTSLQRQDTSDSCEAATGMATALTAEAGAHRDGAGGRRIDAMVTAPVAIAMSLQAGAGNNPQQPLSERHPPQAQAAGARDGGRDDAVCGHSGPGSSRSGPVSSACRPLDSTLSQRGAGTASWAVSPATNITETAETDGPSSSNRWETLPLSSRWDKLPLATHRLEQLPTSTQPIRCASPVVPGGLEGAPVAVLPAARHTPGDSETIAEDDFHSRLCAYVSSFQVPHGSPMDRRVSAVDAEAHAGKAAPQLQQQTGAGAGAQGATGLLCLDIKESLTTAQAELAGRQQAAQYGGARRRDLVLTSVLGSGSFGVVFNGTWRGLRVAVKTLVVHDSLLGAEARRRHRAILEAAISKSLNHLNVVATYETEVIPLSVPTAAPGNRHARPDSAAAGAGPGLGDVAAGDNGCAPAAGDAPDAAAVLDSTTDTYKLMLIMEYCDAGSLARALEMGAVGSVAAGGVPAMCALTLALDVACGMRHIHARNIVHGDLSAGNILLCSTADQCHGGDPADAPLRSALGGLLWAPPLVAKIADFGLSVHMGEHQTHASNRFQGTPAYTAPEVLSRGRLSAAADVWSFGCILLELTYGERMGRIRARAAAQVAAANTTSAAGGKVVAVPWCVPPPGSSPRLVQLLASCLSVDPSARPSFDQVAEALVAILVETHHNTQQSVLATLVMKGDAPQQQQQHS